MGSIVDALSYTINRIEDAVQVGAITTEIEIDLGVADRLIRRSQSDNNPQTRRAAGQAAVDLIDTITENAQMKQELQRGLSLSVLTTGFIEALKRE